jgi:uncharacterized repeat protein (TIGR01451 family)
MKKINHFAKFLGILLLLLGFILIFQGDSSAQGQKSLYVNADLNNYSPIRSYAILPAPTYLTHQATSNTTGYGGAGLAIDTDSETLFVTFEGSGSLKIVDARTMVVPTTGVSAPGASNLAGIVVDQERQKVYTVDRNTAYLYQYTWDAVGKTLTLDRKYTLLGLYAPGSHGFGAHGVALDEAGDLLYVTDVTNQVKVYNTSDWSAAATVSVAAQRPMGIALDEVRNALYTGNAYPPYGCTGQLVKTDLSTGPPTETAVNVRAIDGSLSTDCVVGLAVDLDTGLVYVTTGNQGSGGSDRILVFDSSLTYLYATGDIGNPTGIVVPRDAVTYNPLNMTKDDGLAEDACVYQGGSITYQLCYDNTTNTYAVNNVTLVDTLPTELDFVSATGGGTYNSGTREVTWNIGTLDAGAAQQCVSLSVQLNSSAAQGATITNPSSIDSDETGPAFANEDTLVCTNQPPVSDPNGPYYGVEGSPISLDGSGSYDPDSDPLTYAWTYTPGADVDVGASCAFGDASAATTTLTCTDDGTYNLTLTVDDGTVSHSASTTVGVSNAAPELGAISVDQTLVPVGTTINASAGFTDPGSNDYHTAQWNWGDGTTPGTVTQGAGSGSVADPYMYSAAGIYTIQLTVTDDDGGFDTEVFQYVVVYDPSAGFVTGGGWIYSEPGAYVPDPDLEGKANFGFVSKYKKGATVPTGNTEFQFHAGDLNFHSSSYQWLVVTGSNFARYKGSGTINGEGDFKFMLWAGDGTGTDGADTFRIKIWEEDEFDAETVIYDNGIYQDIGGGSIVVHTKKK